MLLPEPLLDFDVQEDGAWFDPYKVDLIECCEQSASSLSEELLEAIRLQAAQGRRCNVYTRALCWRLFLGVIPFKVPPAQWAGAMAERRATYAALKQQHWPDITQAQDDPLSSGGAGAWQQFYEHQELVELIRSDLARLYPSGCGEYLLTPRLQQLLLAVLVVWSRIHQAISYRQGMHEVLALLVLVLEKEGMDVQRNGLRVGGDGSGACPAALRGVVLDARESQWLEHDSFWLFSQVMEGLAPLYANNGALSAAAEPRKELLQALCDRAQGERLAAVDPELEAHLRAEDVSPQLYGVRWARLLFVREFDLQDCLQLWDWLFSGGGGGSGSGSGSRSSAAVAAMLAEGIEVIMTAMLMGLRAQLLAEDGSGCLPLLMNYTPPTSVQPLLALAGNLRGPVATPAQAAASSAAPPAQALSPRSPPPHRRASTHSALASASGSTVGAGSTMLGHGVVAGSPQPAYLRNGMTSSPARLNYSPQQQQQQQQQQPPQQQQQLPYGDRLGFESGSHGSPLARSALTNDGSAAGGTTAMPVVPRLPEYSSSGHRSGGSYGAGGSGQQWSSPLRQTAEDVGRNLLHAVNWATEGVNRAYHRYETDGLDGTASSLGGPLQGRRYEAASVAPTPEAIYTSELGRQLRNALRRVREASATLQGEERREIEAGLAEAEVVAAVLLREQPLPRAIAAAAAAVG